MAENMPVGLSSLTDLIEEINSIDGKLVVIKGTASEWLKKGTEAAESTVLKSLFEDDSAYKQAIMAGLTPMAQASTLGEYISAVNTHKLEVEQLGNELATSWIKAHRTDADESAALRDRREALVVQATAFKVVFSTPAFLAMLGLASADELPEVPSAKAPRSSGGSTTKSGASKTMTFYRMVGGNRAFQGDTQDKLSSVAWYHFKVRTEILRAAIEAQHGKVDETKPWEGLVRIEADAADDKKVHEWTIGWDMVAQPEAPADEASTDDEAPEGKED